MRTTQIALFAAISLACGWVIPGVFADMPHGGSYDSIKSGHATTVIEGKVTGVLKKPYKLEISGKDESGEPIRRWREIKETEYQQARSSQRELGKIYWFHEAIIRITKHKSRQGTSPLPSAIIVGWAIYPENQADVPHRLTLKEGETYTFCLRTPLSDVNYGLHVYPAEGSLPKYLISLFDSGGAPGIVDTLTWNEEGGLAVTDRTRDEGFPSANLRLHGQPWQPPSTLEPGATKAASRALTADGARPKNSGSEASSHGDDQAVGDAETTPRSVIVVMSLAALGLLWLLFRKRK